MFLATDHSKLPPSDVPRRSTFDPGDWRILAGFWHPIAFAHEIGEKPVAAKLLDVDLVIFRTSAGVTVARDLCVHRGTKVSGGWISNDRLVCPMHGLEYEGSGRCVRIPSVADPDLKIPSRLRLNVYRSEIRYGIVWTCLTSAPVWPLPVWRPIEPGGLEPVFIPVSTWAASAGRHVENFNDVAHFPWVHGGTFGGAIDATFEPYEVRQTEAGLAFDLPYTELGNRFPDNRPDLKNREVVYRYELTFPFSTQLEVDVQGSDFIHYIFDTVCPASARETRIFQIMTDNTGAPDRDYWTKDALAINAQDQPLVEAQEPFELPLDPRDEAHIPADRMSLAYRKALAGKFGLGRGQEQKALQES